MVRKGRTYPYTTAAPRVAPRAMPRITARPATARRRKLSSLDRAAIALAGLVAAGVLLLAALGAGMYAYFTLFERVLPGVRAGGIPLGGLSVDAAAERLQERWQAGALAVSDGQQSWAVSAVELGFHLDARATAEQAYRAGRGESGWPSPFALLQEPPVVAPVVTLDTAQARARLQSAAALMDAPAVEAAVRFENGRWVAIPGAPGRALAIEETVASWAADPSGALRSGTLPARTRPVPPAVMDASAEAGRLNTMLDVPLRLSAFDPVTGETLDLSIAPQDLASMVRVQEGAQQITLDPAAFQAYLQNNLSGLGSGRYLDEVQGLDRLAALWQSGQPLEARVRYRATAYTVQPGDTLLSISYEVGIPWFLIRDANPGMNTESLSAGQQITLPPRDSNLPLPVVRNKRIVISISQQRLWSYQDGQMVTQSIISTGIARSPTMAGVFQVRSHDINAYASNWDLWMPHFMGIYEASPGFMNGIHGLPLLSSGVRLWGNVLGSPASYGCIILTLQEAEALYNWADEGTVVEIQP